MPPFSTLIFFGGPNSKVADGSVTRARAVRPRVTSVGVLPTSSVGATQLTVQNAVSTGPRSGCCVNTPVN
eukprot:scaffold122006_cov63-Phaeocystis_antarctica.AAC.1